MAIFAEKTPAQSAEKRPRRKMPLHLTIGLLGLLGAWAAGQLVPMLSLTLPAAERIRLAEESVTNFRQEQIDSGVYNALQETIDPGIEDSVNKMIFHKQVWVNNGTEREPINQAFSATTIIVDEFIDNEGKLHKILLLNAHAMPKASENTVTLKTDDGLFAGSTTCLPYDYVGKNLYHLDQNQPIHDLALCDLKIIKAPRFVLYGPPSINPADTLSKLEPLDLNRFSSPQNYAAEARYTIYGFPINVHSTETQLLTEPHDSLVAQVTYDHTKNGYPYFTGDPYGPGGSGGLLMHNGRIEGIMASYNVPNLTSALNATIGYNNGEVIWSAEPIPPDLAEKIRTFKDMAMGRAIQTSLLQEEFTYLSRQE